MNKFLRKKLMLLGLLAPLSLTGCKDKEVIEKQHITIECDNFSNNEEFDKEMDQLLGLDKSRQSKNLYGQKLDYDYLIDFTSLSESDFINTYTNLGFEELPDYCSFARLVGKSIITNKINPFDKKKAMTDATFAELKEVLIETPDSLKNENIPYECYTYEVTTEKFVSLEGKTYYHIVSNLTFKESIEKYSTRVKSKDYIKSESLYQLSQGQFKLVSRNQIGMGSKDYNVVNSNLNIAKILPIGTTQFKNMNGEYTNAYAREALDTYAETDYYYSPTNDEIDFSEYKVKKKK